MTRALLLPLLVVALPSAQASAADAPDPAALLFSEKCASCHTVGQGKKVGPDLIAVGKRRDRVWFAKFVRGPSAMIDGGDPAAAELFREFGPVRMPDHPLSDDEVDGLWTYLGACTDKGGCQPVSLGPKWGTDAAPEEIERGRALFLGERRLERGGAPCFACHDARGTGFMGGGTLGPDLTFAYARLGEKGLHPLLETLSTPVMKATYANAPLEDDERFALKAYLAHLARDGAKASREKDLFWIGLEGMGVVLGGLAIVWGGRRAGGRS